MKLSGFKGHEAGGGELKPNTRGTFESATVGAVIDRAYSQKAETSDRKPRWARTRTALLDGEQLFLE
jgi:hypothetical protein